MAESTSNDLNWKTSTSITTVSSNPIMQASVATSSDYYDLLLERQQEQRSSTSLANNTLETPINTSNENKRFRNESDDEAFEEAVETSELADELPEVNSKKKESKEDFFKYGH